MLPITLIIVSVISMFIIIGTTTAFYVQNKNYDVKFNEIADKTNYATKYDYDKNIVQEQTIQDMQSVFGKNIVDLTATDIKLDKQITETDTRLTKTIQETDTRLTKTIGDTDTRLTKTINSVDNKFNSYMTSDDISKNYSTKDDNKSVNNRLTVINGQLVDVNGKTLSNTNNIDSINKDLSNLKNTITPTLISDINKSIDSLSKTLSDYVKKVDLNTYAKSTDLNAYAKSDVLNNYAKSDVLLNYASKNDLNIYAKASDINTQISNLKTLIDSIAATYVKTADLKITNTSGTASNVDIPTLNVAIQSMKSNIDVMNNSLTALKTDVPNTYASKTTLDNINKTLTDQINALKTSLTIDKITVNSQLCVGSTCVDQNTFNKGTTTGGGGNYTAGTQLKFPNNGTGLSWGADYSKIYDNGNLHIDTDDNMYLKAPGLLQIESPNVSVTGTINTPAGHKIYSAGRQHISGEENLYLLNKGGVITSKAWGGNGNLSVEGDAQVAGSARVAGDIVTNGKNNWIIHTPDDGRRIMYIAPSKTEGAEDWDWNNHINFNNVDGSINTNKVNTSGISSMVGNGGANRFNESWFPYVDGNTYIRPGSDGKNINIGDAWAANVNIGNGGTSVNINGSVKIKNGFEINKSGGDGWWNKITKNGDNVIINTNENLDGKSFADQNYKNGITLAPWNGMGGLRVHGGGVDVNSRVDVHNKIGVSAAGIETIDNADWMRIFGSTTNGIALHNGVSINQAGGLNVGEWAKVPEGTVNVTDQIKVRYPVRGDWSDTSPLVAATSAGKAGASFRGETHWSHFPWMDGDIYIRPGSDGKNIMIGDVGAANVNIGKGDTNVNINGNLRMKNWGATFDRGWDNNPSITFDKTSDLRIHGIGAEIANLRVDGKITTERSFETVSDKRLKENINNVTNTDTNNINLLNPVSYNLINDKNKEKQYGFIAQDVEKIYPNLVGKSIDGTKTLNYTGLLPIVTKNIQKLNKQVKEDQLCIDDICLTKADLIKLKNL